MEGGLFQSTVQPWQLCTLQTCFSQGNYTTPVAKDKEDSMYVDNVISGCDQETEFTNYYHKSGQSWMKPIPIYAPGYPKAQYFVKKQYRIKQLISVLR